MLLATEPAAADPGYPRKGGGRGTNILKTFFRKLQKNERNWRRVSPERQ